MPSLDSFVGAGLNDSPWKEALALLRELRERIMYEDMGNHTWHKEGCDGCALIDKIDKFLGQP